VSSGGKTDRALTRLAVLIAHSVTVVEDEAVDVQRLSSGFAAFRQYSDETTKATALVLQRLSCLLVGSVRSKLIELPVADCGSATRLVVEFDGHRKGSAGSYDYCHGGDLVTCVMVAVAVVAAAAAAAVVFVAAAPVVAAVAVGSAS